MISAFRHVSAYLSRTCLSLGLVLFVSSAQAQNTTANEGGDLAFGGAGTEAGKFLELRDLTLDARGNVYTLDGARIDDKTKKRIGNLRVQKFSSAGKLLATIDLRDEATGDKLGPKNDPRRLAVDAGGNVYVTQPTAGRVQQFGADGKLVRSIKVPDALAITFSNTNRERSGRRSSDSNDRCRHRRRTSAPPTRKVSHGWMTRTIVCIASPR